MKVQSYKYKHNDIYIVPLGDLHIGDKCFTSESLRELKSIIDWVKKTSNAYIFLMGDLVNCATLSSPSNPLKQDMDLREQIDYAVNLLKCVSHKIVGAIDGNHELRLDRFSGYSPTISICEQLGTHYFKNSAVLLFRLGCRKTGRKGVLNSSRATFSGYFHHSTGGGNLPGSRLNRADKLRCIVSDVDFYCAAHNHFLSSAHNMIFRVNETTEKIEEIRQMTITTGGFLEYDESYSEEKMFAPLKIGCPIIHLKTIQGDKETRKEVEVKI